MFLVPYKRSKGAQQPDTHPQKVLFYFLAQFQKVWGKFESLAAFSPKISSVGTRFGCILCPIKRLSKTRLGLTLGRIRELLKNVSELERQ